MKLDIKKKYFHLYSSFFERDTATGRLIDGSIDLYLHSLTLRLQLFGWNIFAIYITLPYVFRWHDLQVRKKNVCDKCRQVKK